jgi:TolA-binding protein
VKRSALLVTGALACGLVLGGCETEAVKNAAPPIRTIARQSQPSQDQLPIIKSEPVAADADKALENYRQVLKLAPDDEVRVEAMRRLADLQVQVEDANGNTDGKALASSISTYKQLLAERPDDRNNDRVLYQLARAQQNSGQTDAAIASLRELGDKYPTSNLMGDAHFRTGELLYALNRFDESEREYRLVMDLGPGTSFFEQAQYKYGWSLFKQGKYEEDLPVFFAILDRELPPGELEDPEKALAAVAKSKTDLAGSALRVSSLSFVALGGGKSVNDYFARKGGEPRFYPLTYNALGDLLLEKRRYTDAADAYAAFIERHPRHPTAPRFQTRVIAAYEKGGFDDLVVREKERYANTYAPGMNYWAGAKPTPEVMTELRKDLEDLGRHYQARAQTNPATNGADFITAAGWYRRILDLYPADPKLPEINLLYADALFDGGRTADAAEQYLKTAYGYGDHPKAQEAAYAAIQAYQRLGREVSAAERPAALRQSVDASLKLADTFPQHPKWAAVLTQAATDLYEIKQLDEAITVADRVLKANPPAAAELRRTALGVVADSRFAQANYPLAEVAYTDLLALVPPGDPQHKLVTEQLAASIYKQGEAARDGGDLRAAADTFLRVGRVTPDASIRPNADYDAAAAYMALKDWPQAETTLEGFRTRFPQNALIADADKKLALAYESDNKPFQAAAAYTRIAQRPSESVDTRREAAWLAGKLYDQARQPQLASVAYKYYVGNFPQPLDRAQDGRRRIADIAKDGGDHSAYLLWLGELVAADTAVGRDSTDKSKRMAAQASLEIGLAGAESARQLRLTLPIAKSLPARKAATEAAIAALIRAAGYGYIDPSTAATYELGVVYRDLSRALMDSERPNLKGDELEQYNLLLEEQANPFDEKAIQTHEANLERLKQGLWNDYIRKSAAALAELSPAKYGKRELREDSYDTLR